MTATSGEVERRPPAKETAAPSSEQVGKGLSVFLSRVPDQLSISSWLPAVFFVGNASVLLALQGHPRLVLTKAVRDLVKLEWGAIVVLVFAVTIVAMVIQGFEFEGLRFWEGYLRSSLLRRWAAGRINAKKGHRTDLRALERKQMLAAFDDARRRALDDPSTSTGKRDMWNALEKVMHRRPLGPGEDGLADAGAVRLRWTEKADPVLLHAWDITRLKLREYPKEHRVLPTRLGNVLRAAEDHVKLGPGEDLEGFMIRQLDALPSTIVSEFSAYRRRLEMYCGLMFTLAGLSAFSVVTLWGFKTDLAWRIAAPTAYAASVWVCYRAAVASALGLGQAVKEAAAWTAKAGPGLGASGP